MNSTAYNDWDVVVIGGGLAGLASSIHPSRSGLRVVCLEPVEHFEHIVGESLDWSAPELFRQLGFEMEGLVQEGIATYKRHVVLQLRDGSRAEYIPSEWLGRPPFNIELRTLHLDRVRLHRKLQDTADQSGVQRIRERAIAVERTGTRLRAIQTASGNRYEARWFVDASGFSSRFLIRQLELPYTEQGPKKVAIWSYVSTKDWQEGTTLYADNRSDEYLNWLWEIPIAPGKISVGYVATGASVKQQRAAGQFVDDILRSQLSKFERFASILSEGGLQPASVRSFQCRVCKVACGPNWIISGEAAGVPDPITGNGVTAALRHAAEGTRLIVDSRHRETIPWHRRFRYNLRVSHMGKFFNALIERLAYCAHLRGRFGLLKTGDIYTTIAWVMNHLYSRIRPDGLLKTAVFCTALSSFRALTWLADQIARLLPSRRMLATQEAY